MSGSTKSQLDLEEQYLRITEIETNIEQMQQAMSYQPAQFFLNMPPLSLRYRPPFMPVSSCSSGRDALFTG